MTAMERAGIKKLTIKEKTGYEIHLERHEEHGQPLPSAYPPVFHPGPMRDIEALHRSAPSMAHHPKEAQYSDAAPAKKEEKEGHYVNSPMVGTYYLLLLLTILLF